MSGSKFISANTNENHFSNEQYKAFELLYDTYAPKALGFIARQTDSLEQAEQLLADVFLKVWQENKRFDQLTEKHLIKTLLLTCKPVNKNRKSVPY